MEEDAGRKGDSSFTQAKKSNLIFQQVFSLLNPFNLHQKKGFVRLWIESSWMKVKHIIISNLVRFTGCNKNAFNEKFPRFVVEECFKQKRKIKRKRKKTSFASFLKLRIILLQKKAWIIFLVIVWPSFRWSSLSFSYSSVIVHPRKI